MSVIVLYGPRRLKNPLKNKNVNKQKLSNARGGIVSKPKVRKKKKR